MKFGDVRKALEGALGNLTPARAQELAKSFLDPGTAKDQVAKTANELMEWSQRNREKMREFVDHEVTRQMKLVGVATQKELDALKKRVRELERGSGGTASGRKPAARKPARRKTTANKKTTAQKPAAPEATA
jgi:polyhydroxyalkanoate synthesis regulator phasin